MRTYRLKLDLQLFNQEKTEKATPKKKQDARKKGQVSKSAELPSSFILLFVFAGFAMIGGYFKERIMGMFWHLFNDQLTMELSEGNVRVLFKELAIDMIVILAPIFSIVIIVAIVGNVMQFGFLLTGEPLKPKFSKLNPLNGFKQIFSPRSLVEFAKSITKLLIIGLLVYQTIAGQWNRILLLPHLSIEQIFNFAAGLTVNLGIKIGSVLVIVAFLDYMYQRYEHAKNLRMSKQDIKDEHKKVEGDPLIKGKIRERQRRMAMQRMMQEVPKADVVITNPTHFAIALQYDATKMEAPLIIAKGMDHIALKIREVAKEHGVITMENKPLARALYERADIGDSIPADLFQAVAEVLAHVYKLKGRVNHYNRKG
ncbi:flagellar biosynthesis protein FlhB [Paenibacillus radicis (ex Gao et al. 2016)]|uniref:Flagellar biosynthetic protein FlhB n=1 Tax=Paenibacillus radicis (ex Gao et al. 2016) TaxID=1737354 RepID=A0A917HIJ1_9BACL|nr:flagellar biosynthesis protein FlhB [Paenibacillus radicis (ex Gao et al. 2016)]GGG80675.1 flagellar biosynthetic protein FlhB [Paenibacillus radicis (ex Gao et al. 2016)]